MMIAQTVERRFHSALTLTLIFLSTCSSPTSAEWMEAGEDCASVNIGIDTIEEDCQASCSPFEAKATDVVELSNNQVHQALTRSISCECSHDDLKYMLCEEKNTLFDTAQPLPSCTSKDVLSEDSCVSFCGTVGMPFKSFDSDSVTCSCEPYDVCSDHPTCSQLHVYPSTAAEDCKKVCGPNATPAHKDWVFVPDEGSDEAQVVLEVSCVCIPSQAITRAGPDSPPQCDEKIIFSDYNNLRPCDEMSLTTAEICGDYCKNNGIPTGFVFETLGGEPHCSCMSDGKAARVCGTNLDQSSDAALKSAFTIPFLSLVWILGVRFLS